MATENFSSQVNDFLVTQNYHPETLDANGRPSNDMEETKIFSFDYVGTSRKNYGTMVIILGDENEMIVMYGDNLGKSIEDPQDRGDFFKFQEMLTNLARRNHWNFTLQDINKINHVQAGIAAIKEGLFEGYYGNRKVSYLGEPTEARLMIRHSQPLGETDQRYRHIESIFIETASGERFKLQHNNLVGARAMLEHVRQGGNPYDIRGSHINEMVTEMKVLARFNRASQGRVMEGIGKDVIENAQRYYKQLRESVKHIATGRGYKNYFESWSPLDISEAEGLVEDIKTLFVEQTLDTRIEAALPLLAKIQQGTPMKEVDIFESWVDKICEGTWSLPDTPEANAKLKELMSKELIVGPDGVNATEQLYDLVGDDQLFDRISELASETNGRANLWDDSVVMDRLQELGIDTQSQGPNDEVAPVDNTQDTGVPDGGQIAPAAPVAPVQEDVAAIEESLRGMLKAAGVAVNEGVLRDDTGNTWDHLLDRFRHEVEQFKQGDELDNDLYDALYDYYNDHGAMPYGVAKARTGDPFEWITQRFANDLGVSEADNMATFTEAPLDEYIGLAAVGEGAGCNMTEAGQYCPEHGLVECGTSAGGMAPVMGEGDQQAFVNKNHDDAINYNAAVTGSYYEGKDDPLARLKSLALSK